MFENDDYIDKKVHLLLDDAVFFLEEAAKSQPEAGDDNFAKHRKWQREAAFTRMSVLNSALLLESAVNCSIATLNISNALFSDIDKLAVISKYEYYLEHVSDTVKLDRGCIVTQSVSELMRTRNSLVHPKPYKGKCERVNKSAKGIYLEVDLGKTQYLKLPNSFWMCRFTHANAALNAALKFLSHFFCDLCKYNEHTIREIIFGKYDTQDPQKWIRIHEEYKFDVRFLVNVQEVKAREARLNELLRDEETKQRPQHNSDD